MFIQSLRLASSRRTSLAVRAFSTSPRALLQDPNRPNSERHTVHKAKKSFEGGLDVQSAAAKRAFETAERDGESNEAEPFDTATEDKGGQAAYSKQKEEALADASTSTQQAQAGSFKDHKAGAQSSDNSPGYVGGKEEAAAPSVLATAKSALGFGTSKAEHEDNKTAGGHSYNTRSFHTSARAFAGKGDATNAANEDGQGARTAVDGGVVGDQSAHLKHHEAGEADQGKGNAASTPHLPSQSSRAANDQHSDAESQKKARFHTSARQLAAKPSGGYVNATIPEPGRAGYDVPGSSSSC